MLLRLDISQFTATSRHNWCPNLPRYIGSFSGINPKFWYVDPRNISTSYGHLNGSIYKLWWLSTLRRWLKSLCSCDEWLLFELQISKGARHKITQLSREKMEIFLYFTVSSFSGHRRANIWSQGSMESKVECVFPMVVWSKFLMGQYRDDHHRKDAPDLSKL